MPAWAKRLLVVTNGGGMAVAAADQASSDGFSMPPMPVAVREARQGLPAFFVPTTPWTSTRQREDEVLPAGADRGTTVYDALPW